jgi:hypothetical protein
MPKGSEKTKEKRVKKLREQLVRFKDNPKMAAKIQGRLATAEAGK